jgi:hypothetical protein
MNAGSNRDLSETLQELLEGVCKTLVYVGILATLAGAGLLIYYCFAAAGNADVAKAALSKIGILDKVLYAGVSALAVGTTVLFWGEQTLAILQLIVAAILYTSPLWLNSLIASPGDAAKQSMAALQNGGILLGAIAICVLLADISTRTRDRFKVGAKADLMKYGKGVKEEPDKQNVFMGRCWQLPYCRKFVRERCPIYHARRTCWRELVGCMCEEDVIRGAMENRVISKDALSAANMIPRNNKLTVSQKRERCKTCVIYNEHQKHKYKAAVPGVLCGFAFIYILAHGPLVSITQVLIDKMSGIVHSVTLVGGSTKSGDTNTVFAEGLLVVFFILGISYAMKILEYMIFTLKV